MNLKLRPYQTDIVDSLRSAFRAGCTAPLLQAPTGSGKTVIFAYITESAANRGNRVMILVHRQELLRQSSDALDYIGVDHGLIAPGKTYSFDNVQIASVQTLVRRLDSTPAPDLIVIDEAHHTAAGSWSKVLTRYCSNGSKTKLLGVTATPQRLDGKGLGRESGGFYDRLVQGPTVQYLIDQGFLSKPVVYAPPTGVDLTDLHSRYGEYIAKELSDRVDKPKITGCAVSHYQRICPDAPAIAFCVSVNHAEHVAEQFRAAGVLSESIDGTLHDTVRKDRIAALSDGRIKVLTSCEIVSEGTDIPIVTTAILLRPTQSMGLHLQQCGRVLRPHPDKKFSIILDHVGNSFRHGLPDEEREWSLDYEDRKKRKKSDSEIAMPYTQCEKCYRVYSSASRVCPECGHEREIEEREVEQVDGELEEIDKAALKRARRQEIANAKSLEELEAYGASMGYKKGWAFHIHRSRQAKRGKV